MAVKHASGLGLVQPKTGWWASDTGPPLANESIVVAVSDEQRGMSEHPYVECMFGHRDGLHRGTIGADKMWPLLSWLTR